MVSSVCLVWGCHVEADVGSDGIIGLCYVLGGPSEEVKRPMAAGFEGYAVTVLVKG